MPNPVAADRLFLGLDGQKLSVDGLAWRVEVYGVFDDAKRRWVQISLAGSSKTILTLRLAQSQQASDAMRELSAWLVDPAAAERVTQHVG